MIVTQDIKPSPVSPIYHRARAYQLCSSWVVAAGKFSVIDPRIVSWKVGVCDMNVRGVVVIDNVNVLSIVKMDRCPAGCSDMVAPADNVRFVLIIKDATLSTTVISALLRSDTVRCA
jgi:hypothetical protein